QRLRLVRHRLRGEKRGQRVRGQIQRRQVLGQKGHVLQGRWFEGFSYQGKFQRRQESRKAQEKVSPGASYSFNPFKYARKSFPNSLFCSAISTVAFKKPSLSPAS